MKKGEFTGINRIFKSHGLQMYLDKKADGTFKEFFSDWKWIFSFSKRYSGMIVLYTVLGVLSSTLALGSSYVSRLLINIIVDKNYQNLVLFSVVLLSSTLFSLVFNSVMSRISARISIHVNNDIQSKVFESLLDAKWAELNKYKNGDLLNRFNQDVNTIATNSICWIPSLLINSYTFILTFIVMVRLDLIMGLIALVSAPVLVFLSRYVLRKMRENRKRVLELNSKMMSFEEDTFSNVDTIKSFGIFGVYSKKLFGWQKKYKDLNLEYNKFEIKANIIMTVATTFVSLVTFFYCLYRLWTGQFTYGDMMFFVQQRSNVTNGFNNVAKTLPNMLNSAVSAHRVRELIELQREVHDGESLERMKKTEGGITVQVKNVSFGYREDQPVYENGNFVARPGEIIAVLGSSGEGKTTLLRILLGLLQPNCGEVTLTGKDGESVPVNADLRQLFSYVPQGNTLLSGTIAENMRVVKEDATDEEIIDALKTACAYEFVEKLPSGMNSELGDGGKGVSMGQGQRIAIARAILRDAPVLMLDEATSALDTETEKRVLKNIVCECPDRTCIISTHRKSVLSQCNRIYRIENGTISEIDKELVCGKETNDFIE